MNKKRPGIRCEKCGSYYDSQDGKCDCEVNPDAFSSVRQTVAHNKAIMKTAFSNRRKIVQAYQNFDYK